LKFHFPHWDGPVEKRGGLRGAFLEMRTPEKESPQVCGYEALNEEVAGKASNLMRRSVQRTGAQPHPPA
jgi:hypothetical protein